MGISQREAVSLINRTIFRPGWRVTAMPAPGSDDQVQAGIEVETVDSSFVTRGGEYGVPLTERALVLMSASAFETAEELLFRVLALFQELQGHEDREFLRTWSEGEERWVAPFHGHVPGSAQAWDRLRALPQAPVTRMGTDGDGPWMDDAAWAAHRRIVNAGCDQEADNTDCWDSDALPRGRAIRAFHPCNEQADDDDEGPQRRLTAAGCAQDGEVNCNTNIDSPGRGLQREFASALAHAAAHPVRVAGCNECDGGCAGWG